MPTVFSKSIIDTPSGRKRAEHLRVGDLVFSRDGTRTEVTQVSKVVVEEPIILKSRQYGAKVAVSPRTYVVIKRGSQNIRRSAQKLRRNDVIIHAGPVEYSAQQLPIDPFALGFFLKSGDIAHSYRADTFIRIDKSYLKGADLSDTLVQEVARALRSNLVLVKNQQSKQVARYSFVGENGKRIKWSDLKRHFPEELSANRKELRIPPCYLRSSVDQRMRLLAGIFAGKGGVSKDTKAAMHIRFVGNLALAQQVMQLARSLGIPSTVDEANARVRMQLTRRQQEYLLQWRLSSPLLHDAEAFEERGFLLGKPTIHPQPLEMVRIQTKSKTLLAEKYFPL